jgi:acetylornithine deacetylase/succinyl-diaminopimelate desuccinylase-like protein
MIDSYLRANWPRHLQLLTRYLRFPSVSAQPSHRSDVAACADWLAQHCRSIGLQAQLYPTQGHPILVATTPPASATPARSASPASRRKRSPKRPRFLVYGHYDVQPAEPFALWKSPPFQPVIRAGSIYARGAADNKGQHFAHLTAVEAYLKTGTPLPCDLVFLIEGEEEIGSVHLADFVRRHRRQLRCDAIVISDTGIPSLRHPALTYGLRGIVALEIELRGPSRDLHSGIYGGTVDNPALALCQMLSQMRDRHGRVTVPGFYDEVAPLSRYERREMARLPMHDAVLRRFLGVPTLFGERGYTAMERRSARPTCEINGLTSGYQGDGSKTIVPALASAKLTFRLVPNQRPEHVRRQITSHLKRLCPPTVRMNLRWGHGGLPYMVSPRSPGAQAALRALRQAFDCEPVLMREGGSIPVVQDLIDTLGAEVFLLGLSLPDDNPHSPDEKFSLEALRKGIRLGTCLWPELARWRLGA